MPQMIEESENRAIYVKTYQFCLFSLLLWEWEIKFNTFSNTITSFMQAITSIEKGLYWFRVYRTKCWVPVTDIGIRKLAFKFLWPLYTCRRNEIWKFLIIFFWAMWGQVGGQQFWIFLKLFSCFDEIDTEKK